MRCPVPFSACCAERSSVALVPFVLAETESSRVALSPSVAAGMGIDKADVRFVVRPISKPAALCWRMAVFFFVELMLDSSLLLELADAVCLLITGSCHQPSQSSLSKLRADACAVLI